jgi:hypothetical protein
MTAVYLSTPCAAPSCAHPYNWHTATAGCTVEACGCRAYAVPADPAKPRTDAVGGQA